MTAESGRARRAVLIALLMVAAVQLTALRASAKETTFVIEMDVFRFSPDLLVVGPGDNVTVVVFNNDTIGHTFDLPAFNVHLGTRADPVPPGDTRNATFTATTEGTFWFFCDVLGHANQRGDGSYTGMAGRLIVGQPPPPPDLTLILVIVGVVGVAAAGVGVFLWMRRPKSP